MSELASFQTAQGQPVANGTSSASPLFIINLCASMTPMPSVPKTLKGFEQYRLYEVSRQEDGRRRYRLRMGFFTTEADAELILNNVRNLYPTAFVGCVTAEDERFTRGITRPTVNIVTASAPAAVAAPAETSKGEQPRKVQTPKVPVTVASKSAEIVIEHAAPAPAAPTSAPAAKPASVTKATSTPASAPVKPQSIQLEAAPVPATPAAARDHDGDTQRFHVARGIQLPEIHLELAPEPVKATPAPSVIEDKPAKAAAPAASTPAPVIKPAAAKSAAVAPAAAAKAPRTETAKPTAPTASAQPVVAPAVPVAAPKVVDDYIPILDTTMTVRALTQAERDDANQPTWFAVQLALSEQPVNLDAMPKLDIFAAYRLYSVALMEEGRIQHALRLGFFKESVSAEAVSGYLKTFFDATTITRIAKAEYDRFAEPKPVAKPASSPHAPAHNVVKLDEKRVMPAAPAQAAARATPRPATLSAPRTGTKGSNDKLAHALREEARKVTLSESGIRPSPRPQSFFSRLIGRNLD